MVLEGAPAPGQYPRTGLLPAVRNTERSIGELLLRMRNETLGGPAVCKCKCGAKTYEDHLKKGKAGYPGHTYKER